MDKELEKKYELLTNILYINMWGEAQRHNNTIYITNVDDSVESKICIKIAMAVNQIHNVNIIVDCGIINYIKILRKYKILFKNKIFKRVPNVKGLPTFAWLYDISDAQGAPREIWNDIWEYINEDYHE